MLDRPLELLEAGAVAVDVHEGVVAPPRLVVVALGLDGAPRRRPVEVHLDGVAPDGEGGEGLEPVGGGGPSAHALLLPFHGGAVPCWAVCGLGFGVRGGRVAFLRGLQGDNVPAERHAARVAQMGQEARVHSGRHREAPGRAVHGRSRRFLGVVLGVVAAVVGEGMVVVMTAGTAHGAATQLVL